MAKITRLDVSNFKRISIVEIEPQTGAVLLGGRNAQGKSSVLDAIDALLRGGKAYPKVPVRKGEAKAKLSCTLDNGITIERGITEAGTTSLKITTADGMSPQHPQAWLDGKLSAATCDPLAFIRSRPQDQAAELRRLTGVDTTELDAERSEVYAQRTQDGRTAKEKAALLAAMPEPGEDVPDEPVSASAIAGELEEAQGLRRKVERLISEAEELEVSPDDINAEINELMDLTEREAQEMHDEAAELRRRAESLDLRAEKLALEATEKGVQMRKAAEEDNEQAAALRTEAASITVPDITAIRARLNEVDTINEQVRKKQRRAEVALEAEQWQATVDAGTLRLKDIDDARMALLADVKWPVEGLGIDDAGTVTFRGVPLAQASQAEQLRVGLALALAGDPEIPVALIRDGSHLDDDALATLADYAEEVGAQVWIERVGTHDAGAVVIEDGTVVSNKAQAKAGVKNGGLL